MLPLIMLLGHLLLCFIIQWGKPCSPFKTLLVTFPSEKSSIRSSEWTVFSVCPIYSTVNSLFSWALCSSITSTSVSTTYNVPSCQAEAARKDTELLVLRPAGVGWGGVMKPELSSDMG